KRGGGGMQRMLVGGDNRGDVYLIREALREHGVECSMQVASDGREVLTLIAGDNSAAAEEFELIILDLNLPRHDGIEILERLRESTRMAHVPVVVLTSSDSPQDRLVATHLGARRYLRKPSSLEQFLELGSVFRNLLNDKPQSRGANNED